LENERKWKAVLNATTFITDQDNVDHMLEARELSLSHSQVGTERHFDQHVLPRPEVQLTRLQLLEHAERRQRNLSRMI